MIVQAYLTKGHASRVFEDLCLSIQIGNAELSAGLVGMISGCDVNPRIVLEVMDVPP